MSVVALEGALKRASSSSSGSSVPRRVLRSIKEVRRVAIELCVGVLLSEVYRGDGMVFPVSRLLLRASSRLSALGLDLALIRSVLIPNRRLLLGSID